VTHLVLKRAAITDPPGGKRPLAGSRQTDTTRLPPDRGARFAQETGGDRAKL
jgi:hypothetical protein